MWSNLVRSGKGDLEGGGEERRTCNKALRFTLYVPGFAHRNVKCEDTLLTKCLHLCLNSSFPLWNYCFASFKMMEYILHGFSIQESGLQYYDVNPRFTHWKADCVSIHHSRLCAKSINTNLMILLKMQYRWVTTFFLLFNEKQGIQKV